MLKNPGCQHCRFYLASFSVDGIQTVPACIKGARKAVREDDFEPGKKEWKWVNCQRPEIKNERRKCEDFQMNTPVHSFASFAKRKALLLEKQFPPAFADEKWWDT